MEFTVDQALQQGVAAHREGKLPDAERLYRAILQAQPKHPDANHNLGVLAVAVGKPLEAIPLFKLALDANPQIEQFWLSYVDVLIELERFDEAKLVLVAGEKSGVASEKLDALKQRLQESAPNDTNKTAQGQTLSEKRKTQGSSSSAAPSQDQINCLIEYYQAGRFDETEPLAVSLTQEFPKHPFGWKVLGAVFKQQGRLAASLAPMQSAVKLSLQDAEAHYNLGVTLEGLGRLDEAAEGYRRAIALKTDYAEAHYNLGNTLQELGRLEDAEASYKQAIALRPDYAEAYSNLGNTLKELGRLDDAVGSYSQAIGLKPDFDDAYVNLGLAVKNVRFKISAPDLYPVLIQLLTIGNFTDPREVAGAILSLLKHDPLLKNLLVENLSAMSLKESALIIDRLHKLPLLHYLMRLCPLPDLQFEGLFSNMRKFLIANLKSFEASPELIYFLSTLSIHCFVNEYIFYESEEEVCLVEELEGKIVRAVRHSGQPDAVTILCLALYRPLNQYEWCQKLEALDNLGDVKTRLIEEPLAERLIAKKIPVLGEISDGISRKVKRQYEENPYPRWVKTTIHTKAKSISKVCAQLDLNLHSEHIKKITAPAILVAGCGTGQHSISTAFRFANCQVTAVDLSLASLAYAQRQTNSLGVANLEYLQADILQLDQFDMQFDIIECVGVLHHMEDPMTGWRMLVHLLKAGGLIRMGLYSELARRHIVRIRQDIALKGTGTSEAEIRQFRQSLVQSQDKHHRQVKSFSDFYSLSMLRDLIFHVQEHHFTLPQLQHCLDELGLKFCGFENKDILKKFKNFYGEESDACELSLWHRYEKENPQTFSGMYQFWCQKM